MQLNRRTYLTLATVFVLLAVAIPANILHSQDNTITLSLVISNYMKDVFDSRLISDFESANPGIKVNLVTDAPSNVPSAAEGIEAHLDAAEKFVSAGDVLMVRADDISPASVAAGYYLDLTPLASADTELSPDDFQHAVWQSFEWDNGTSGGLWGLPVSENVWYISYDPAALEQAGYTDPPGNWTFDVFADALRKLTVKDASGSITTPALMGLFTGYNDGALMRGLANETWYDGSTRPVTPDIAKSQMNTFAEVWSQLADEGLLDVGKGRFTQIPMILLQQSSLTTQAGAAAQSEFDANRLNTLLPGGRSGLDVQGLAISSGTLYPEQAYALAKFLTTRPEIASYFGNLPARTSLFDEAITQYTAEDQDFLRGAIDVAVPVSELRFSDYFQKALAEMKAAQIDAKTALEAQTAQAISDLQAAADRKAMVTITVATPAPPVNLAAGEVSLKFGVGEFADPLPTQALWDDVIADFISNDPQVRQIKFEKDFRLDNTNEGNFDCFYMPINTLSAQSASSLLSLDPLLAADPSFDKDDMIGNTLDQLTIDGKVWAMPIVLFPSVLSYNSDVFKQAGVNIPDSNWTVDQFKDTLTALKQNTAGDPPFFLNAYSNGSPLLMLMAAYGGAPLDFRTNPPTIRFTEPANVMAIREVLDLAKQGYIKYPTLSDMTGSSNPGLPTETTALYDDSLNVDNEAAQSPFKPISYPRGTQYAGATYGIGFAAIMANSANPDACYRWINTFARHPELFSGMPARRSLINDPALSAAQGNDMVAIYNAIADQLADPNTLIMPDPMNADPTVYLLQHWLNEAFDKYVIDGADLDSALQQAEVYAKDFQACAATLPAYEPYSEDSAKEYFKAFGVCAVKVDARLSSIYDGKPKG